jgi:hypothetical protein
VTSVTHHAGFPFFEDETFAPDDPFARLASVDLHLLSKPRTEWDRLLQPMLRAT